MEKKVGRNDPCPCGSGKKYKKCCGVVKPRTINASVIKSVNQSSDILGRLQSIKDSTLNLTSDDLDEATFEDFKQKITKATGEMSDTLKKLSDSDEKSS